MTITDTDALTERLWEAVAEVRDQHPRVFNDAPTDDVVAAVLPIVAVEVRKAKAEAWDEGQHDLYLYYQSEGLAGSEGRNPYSDTETGEAMSTDEYVLRDEDMREDHVQDRANPDAGRRQWDAWIAAHDARVRRDAVQQFADACKEKRDQPGFLLPVNYFQDLDAAIRVAESYVKNYPEETP